MTARALGSSSPAALLNPLNPPMATTSTRPRQSWSRWENQALRTFLTPARDHVQQTRWPHLVAHSVSCRHGGGALDIKRKIQYPPLQ